MRHYHQYARTPAARIDFSPIYFTTGTRLLTWKASKVSEIENLSGKMIAVVGGSTNEKAVRGLIDKGQLSGAATPIGHE
ncbi:hypothetical protein ACVOMV_34635 [Mesorhizobium atlanticum]